MSSSASGSASSSAHPLGQVAGEARQVALDLEPLLEHRQGVAVDVEVVVRVLDDAADRLELRQHDGGQLQLVQQLQRPQRVRPAEHRPQLGELALARPARPPALASAGQRGGALLELERVPGGEPRRAQQPQRVLGEGAAGRRAEAARPGVGEAAGGVERVAAAERDRDRVHGEVARARGRPRSPGRAAPSRPRARPRLG